MIKFVAGERNPDEACFVYEESSKLVLELNKPADLGHAQTVAKYLNQHVRALSSDTKVSYTVTEGSRTIKRGTIP